MGKILIIFLFTVHSVIFSFQTDLSAGDLSIPTPPTAGYNADNTSTTPSPRPPSGGLGTPIPPDASPTTEEDTTEEDTSETPSPSPPSGGLGTPTPSDFSPTTEEDTSEIPSPSPPSVGLGTPTPSDIDPTTEEDTSETPSPSPPSVGLGTITPSDIDPTTEEDTSETPSPGPPSGGLGTITPSDIDPTTEEDTSETPSPSPPSGGLGTPTPSDISPTTEEDSSETPSPSPPSGGLGTPIPSDISPTTEEDTAKTPSPSPPSGVLGTPTAPDIGPTTEGDTAKTPSPSPPSVGLGTPTAPNISPTTEEYTATTPSPSPPSGGLATPSPPDTNPTTEVGTVGTPYPSHPSGEVSTTAPPDISTCTHLTSSSPGSKSSAPSVSSSTKEERSTQTYPSRTSSGYTVTSKPLSTTTISITTTRITSSQPSTTTSAIQVTQSPSITTTAEPCYNGGTHDGVKCICSGNLFYGPKCEFPVKEIYVEQIPVNVSVQAQVTVTNRNYSKELNDTHSKEFKYFENDFKKKMNRIYEDIPKYQDVKIVRLRSGSIIVDHDVIFKTNVTNNISTINTILEDLEKNTTDLVLEKLIAINTTEDDCMKDLCFIFPPNPVLGVTTTNFSPDGYCKIISDYQYEAYYYANTSTGALRCLSNCSSDNPYPLTCNHGICAIALRGAQCNCTDLNLFWYLDGHCDTRIQKSEVGLGLGLALLFVTSAILAFLLFKARQRKSTSSFTDDIELWCGDDVEEEWRQSERLGVVNESSAPWNEYEERSKVFRPHLSTVDTTTKLQFQKPKIVS